MRAETGWRLPEGTRLWNTGSWVYAPGLLGRTAADSPYWPGTVALLEDDGPPELRHLLDDRSRDELRGAVDSTEARRGAGWRAAREPAKPRRS